MSESFLELAQKFNNFFLMGHKREFILPFIICGQKIGYLKEKVVEELRSYYNTFNFYSNYVEFNAEFKSYEDKSKQMEAVLKDMKIKGKFHNVLKGWRNECYQVKATFDKNPLLKMERSATCLFGIQKYGVDVNGYVQHPERGLCVWIQKRASTKTTWPGKYDNMVAGGLTAGLSVESCVLKEAKEEASIPSELLIQLRPAGCVSERGIFPNTEFIFDLELPVDFIPTNQDGEVESFTLLTVQELSNVIKSQDFKTTSCPVALDFLIRHGVINIQNGNIQ